MTKQDQTPDDVFPANWELRPLEDGEFEFVEPMWPAEVDDLLDEAHDALEEGSFEEAAEIVEQALEVSPDNLEALLMLADVRFEMEDDKGRLQATEKAFAVVQKYLPADFHAKDCLLPGDLEGNALLLYAYFSHGCALADSGQPELARRILEDLLHMDPEDPNEARLVLPSLYLELHEPTQLLVLRDKYPSDHSAEILWNIPLAFLHLDEADMARVAVKNALAKSPKAANMLLSADPKPPKDLEAEPEVGSEQEAYLYVQATLPLWRSTKGALGLLREIVG